MVRVRHADAVHQDQRRERRGWDLWVVGGRTREDSGDGSVDNEAATAEIHVRTLPVRGDVRHRVDVANDEGAEPKPRPFQTLGSDAFLVDGSSAVDGVSDLVDADVVGRTGDSGRGPGDDDDLVAL